MTRAPGPRSIARTMEASGRARKMGGSHPQQQSYGTRCTTPRLELRVCKPPGVGASLIEDSKWESCL